MRKEEEEKEEKKYKEEESSEAYERWMEAKVSPTFFYSYVE